MDPGPRGIACVGLVSTLTESCSLHDLAYRLTKCLIWGLPSSHPNVCVNKSE